MQFAITMTTAPRAALIGVLLSGVWLPAFAQSAYIAQVNSFSSGAAPAAISQSVQTVPVYQYTPGQTAYVPTPEMAVPRNGNVAQTLQVGNYNRVVQSQSGGGNLSNVGIIGGNANNVGVLQAGKDVSNLGLINTQGLSIAVIQPPGSAPVNALIARLPNGSLLIKR